MIKPIKVRRQPLSEKRCEQVGESYRLMYILMSMAELEYQKYMDTDFQNPMIHATITKIKEGISRVLSHHKVAVDDSQLIPILEFTDDMLTTVKLMANNMEPREISAFAAGVGELIKAGKEEVA